jgi:hypothetical protein
MCNRYLKSGKKAWWLVLPALAVLVVGAAAQNQGAKQQPAPGACPMCPQGQAMGGMPMWSQHQEMAKLIDQVSKSAAALEKENDPAALKKKVTEHNALVKKLDAKFHSMDQMMKQMEPMGGPPTKSL